MGRALNRISSALAYVAAALLVFVTLIITIGIICRFMNWRGPIWVNQFSEYSLLAITFLGTGWLLMQEKHTSVSVVVDMLPPSKRAVLKQLHMIVGAVLCGGLFWFTARSTWDHAMRGVMDVGTIDFPKAVILAVIPIGFLLLTCQFLQLLGKYHTAWKDLKRPGGPPAGSLAAAMLGHSRGADEGGQ